jgi:c-di-GMP-binding flagellar brake protein YcgR
MGGIERRQHHRYSPDGLKATITLGCNDDKKTLQGEVVDISFDGVKIHLDDTAETGLEGKIHLDLFLPDSNTPFSVDGVLKHKNNQGELGLHYIDCPIVEALDSFLFECIKLSDA